MVVNRIENLKFDAHPEPQAEAQILVVDDDREIADFLGRRALEYFDLPVLLAGSLSEAHAALDEHTPQIAIVDLVLPDGDGTDLLLRLERDNVPAVAVITAAANLARATLALQTRAADFLVKPHTDEQLNATFERLARRLAEHEAAARLAKHAAAVDDANQQLRMKIDILCKDLVNGYQKLVARMTQP